jgi:LmbE family N-acetylglucosaminyl deacetylase
MIARYVAEGAQVDLICATDGDAGTIDPEHLDGYDSVRERRLAELDCAARVLGFRNVVTYGYRDSNMMGHPDNENPACLWYAEQHDPDTLTRRVVETIRTLKPQVIVTFNKYGGYGHPDHIAIQRATTRAFTLAGDDSYITEGLPPYQPQKLYYSSIPAFYVRFGIWQARLARKDPRKLGRNKDIDLVAILDHIEPAHTRIDVTTFMDAWDASSACHTSQGGGQNRRNLTRWLRRIMPVQQKLTRIHPAPAHDRIDEYDLFAGVTFDQPEDDPIAMR